ncbi:hypothetical protein [Candidatus Similichlamydia epinepheli]|uniref:hypothetical protein n=1 Tax=Candidatus Similichlamydia epinepheli TaxID=1903953 RepID=UPI001300A6B7|nr:hypothetical protein [Candidatus Similichlamydia epinepheli]
MRTALNVNYKSDVYSVSASRLVRQNVININLFPLAFFCLLSWVKSQLINVSNLFSISPSLVMDYKWVVDVVRFGYLIISLLIIILERNGIN